MSLSQNMVTIISTIFVAWIYNKYLIVFFDYRQNKPLHIFFYWFTYVLLIVVFDFMNIVPIYLNIFINIILGFIMCILIFEGGFLKKVFLVIVFNVLGMISEIIFGFISMQFDIKINVQQMLGAIVSKAILCIIIVFLEKIFSTEHYVKKLNKYNLWLLLVPCFSIYLVDYIFILNATIEDESDNLLTFSFITILVILFLNILVFRVYKIILKEAELEKANAVYSQQADLYAKYLSEKENSFKQEQKYKHDLKQHLLVIDKYAQIGKNNELSKYVDKLLSDSHVIKNQEFINTNNMVIDALVNHAFQESIENNIKMDADILVPHKLPFLNNDLAIILGNLLDNALEACKNVETQKRYINICIKYNKYNLLIMVENSYDGYAIMSKSGRLISRKKTDNYSHGWGLRTIENTAKKYQGLVTICKNNNCFSIKVLLYGDKDLKEKGETI